MYSFINLNAINIYIYFFQILGRHGTDEEHIQTGPTFSQLETVEQWEKGCKQGAKEFACCSNAWAAVNLIIKIAKRNLGK